jgi:hypothetical protein
MLTTAIWLSGIGRPASVVICLNQNPNKPPDWLLKGHAAFLHPLKEW